MPEAIEKEIEAIKTLLTALEPLQPKVRESVIDYVLRRLDIRLRTSMTGSPIVETPPLPPGEPSGKREESPQQMHIMNLVEQKQPRSAIEMATLVAYYLSHMAPQNERKQTITTKDIATYFKIANFKPPAKPQFTLPNTKGAGYLDAVGDGEYKLNPVGYNLVVHSMPKSKGKTSRRRAQRKKSTTKKAIKRKK